MTSILCFYHAPCNDGAASAAALKYRLDQAGYLGGEFEMHFVQLAHATEWLAPYQQGYVDQIQPGHAVGEIYILDAIISQPKYEQVLGHLRQTGKLGPAAPRTICIDHHATAVEKSEEIGKFCQEMFIRIGAGLSAATLVWQYCNTKFGEAPMPELLRYVADQDVWEWLLPDSKQINAALNTLEGNAGEMERELAACLAGESAWRNGRREQGRTVLLMVESQIHKALAHVRDLPSEDGVVLRLVNFTAFSSELGNHLCQQSHHAPNAVAAVYAIQKDWSVKCSLRSIDGAAVNARTIAERFGGGGHDNAAGCRFANYQEFIAAIESLTKKTPDSPNSSPPASHLTMTVTLRE